MLCLTILSFIGLGALAILPDDIQGNTEGIKRFSDACDFGWKAGLGAIFGLLGGKAAE